MPGERHRILVFQPLFPEGTALDYRMLGLTHWVADQLGEVGLEGASAVFGVPTSDGSTPTKLGASEPLTDAKIREALAANESRYGLLPSFTSLGGVPQLAVARLYEVKRGHPLRTLARWTFEGDTHAFPVAAHNLFVLVATRLGVTFHPHDWTNLFETHDVGAASNYLTALGCFTVCDRGVALDDTARAIPALLSAIGTGMPPAIRLLPHFVDAALRSGAVDEVKLREMVDDAVALVGVVPDDWVATQRSVGIVPGVVN